METQEKKQRFTDSITFKALIVLALTLLLLIPQAMITSLIRERKERSEETIRKINEKWSNPQTICGPVLNVASSTDKYVLTPSILKIDAKLSPKKMYYGIYKTILYKSELQISGSFNNFEEVENLDNRTMYWDEAYISIGISDLKGLVSNAELTINGKTYTADAEGSNYWFRGNMLKFPLKDFQKSPSGKNEFSCKLMLNGSENINFIPVGRTTEVKVSGKWSSPSFIGNFSSESTVEKESFSAKWNIMHFNRNIPEVLVFDSKTYHHYLDNEESSFGVGLIETVGHYQQNERSSKYALMFIALTFVVFFFVEVLTKKKIHIIQYLLVGIALILFYSLLLSISEQIGFALAYLIASFATIGLISAYAQSIFKNKLHTGILTLILCVLYTFLYVILQLEDLALLIGSVGLFAILGVIMYLSRKINW